MKNMEKNSEKILKLEEEEMSHEAEVQKQWEESQNNFVIAELRRGKGLAEVIKSLEGFKEAFLYNLDTIVCSDERVPAGLGRKIGLAGQLILASAEELEKFIKTYQDGGLIKYVTSHDDCGAAKIKFSQLVEQGNLPEGIATADELGIAHSKELATQLKAEYRHIYFPTPDNLSLENERMTDEVHNARAICFDGTGKFNPAIIKEMPNRYVCSAPGFGLSDEYAESELSVLTGIALGDHGFGGRFNSETPFYIIVSAKDEAQLIRLREIAKRVCDQFQGRVVEDGFVAK
jgi:hypothetical protein